MTDLEVAGKKVIVRLDLDTEAIAGKPRIKYSEETLDYLKDKNSKIIIIAHKGRPEGRVDEALSLMPFKPIFEKWGADLMENLRFDEGEEENNPEFAKKIAEQGDVYVNESFADSHRKHASIVGIPKLLPHAAGFRFIKEVENLSKVFNNPKKPAVFLLSGAKEDKLNYLKSIEKVADTVLVGGRLPDFLGDRALESVRTQKGKTIVGNLVMDKEDITLNTIQRFSEEIQKAGTVVVSGPLGKYEEEGHRAGTKQVFEKVIANKEAFKVAGGGSTQEAITLLGLTEGFNWISVGGGAMLEFLIKKTLPGIEALK